MKVYQTSQIRNVALLGNSGSGKTTFAEDLLLEGKVIDRRGSVQAKTTVSDYSEVEQLYQRSIYPTVLYTEYKDTKINFIDTPGSDDFCGGIFSAFRVVDAGIMMVNAQNGVEVGTETIERHAESHNKPLMMVVNQLDSDKANFENTIESLRQAFGGKIVEIQYPYNPGTSFDSIIDVMQMKMFKYKADGSYETLDIPAGEADKAAELQQKLIESAAEYDESLMEIFFEEGSLTEEQMFKGLKLGLKNRECYPVFCASAANNIGTRQILDFIVNVMPSPAEIGEEKTTSGEVVPCDASKPASLFVFKTSVEQHLGEVCYFRVMSGKVSEAMDMNNAQNGIKERISQIYISAGRKREKVSDVVAGDIACTVKLKGTRNNQTLNAGTDWQYPATSFPNPKFRTAIKAAVESDEQKLGEALNRLSQEDPTILVEYSKELKQVIVSGQGEHHINILKWNLSNNYKIEVNLLAPKIPYRETITKVALADYRHKKQSGGAGQFGEVHLLIEPYYDGMPEPKTYKIDGKELTLNIKGKEEYDLEWGGKLQYYNCIVGGAIDARFMPAILKGIMEKMEEGPLTGSYARDIRVAVYDGKMHPVDSNEISFKLAGRNAFKEAFKKAAPKIMEPIYNVSVFTPGDCMGDVMSDLQNRRSIIAGMHSVKGFQVINAQVPLAELDKYSTTLSSLTSGRATYEMEFAEYQQVPADVQSKLLKAYEEQEKDE
ncbi:MAG: elongation factor G [Bacteroidales bacterium]|nr:elongation factor G [Bacteroidales bacterium]MCR5714438.1 elongation factor G [Bacteroidales bacterium]